MTLWEYWYVETNTSNARKFVAELNERGMDGWQLVGFASADKTIGLNSLFAIITRARKELPRPPVGTVEGWIPDPSGRHPDRYWDGGHWTRWVRDKAGGNRSEDPPYGPVLHSD